MPIDIAYNMRTNANRMHVNNFLYVYVYMCMYVCDAINIGFIQRLLNKSSEALYIRTIFFVLMQLKIEHRS